LNCRDRFGAFVSALENPPGHGDGRRLTQVPGQGSIFAFTLPVIVERQVEAA
jgi:hypothetical protein